MISHDNIQFTSSKEEKVIAQAEREMHRLCIRQPVFN